ncbi:hypothetical protein B0H10DRAFT_2131473, partial [Mycena sp. CBHHK59/15]
MDTYATCIIHICESVPFWAVALLYDHLWTFADEVRLVWFNPEASLGNRIGFMINRYITEVVALYVVYVLSGGSYSSQEKNCRIFIWVLSISATVFTAISHGNHYYGPCYTLWDRRPLIKWILMCAFGVAISISMAFALLTAHQAKLEANGMCAFLNKPWALPYALGAMACTSTGPFDLTTICISDRPGFIHYHHDSFQCTRPT